MAVVTVLVAVLVTAAMAEVVVRRIDHLPLRALRLPATPVRVSQPSSRDSADLRYVPAIPLAPGVDPAWYRHDPPPHQQIPMTAALQARYEHYKAIDPIGAFWVWNRIGLHDGLCNAESAPAFNVYDDYLVFDPSTNSPNPPYRLMSRIQPPGWFPTNQFGWRGPDLPLNKPAGTIRIAFLGSSKTLDPYGASFSHIEYIGEWLNLWLRARGSAYRVEVINAARTGIGEAAISAILRDEVLPLEPDLVIDDGGNNFAPFLLLSMKDRARARPSRSTGETAVWATDAYSALSRRVHSASITLRHLDGSEPSKPSVNIDWPRDVDEQHPDITKTPLPMGIEKLLVSYDEMRAGLQAQGGQLGLPSWVFMARDGLKLDLPRDLLLFNSLGTFYPMSYAQLHRANEFYNRAFRAYADHYGLPFFDMAAVSPLDPELFGDTVHMTPPGLRLESWNYLQMIARWLDGQLASGALPRPMRHPLERHPAFQTTDYAVVTKADVLKTCR